MNEAFFKCSWKTATTNEFQTRPKESYQQTNQQTDRNKNETLYVFVMKQQLSSKIREREQWQRYEKSERLKDDRK